LILECILLASSYCVPIDIPRDFRAPKPSESRIALSRPISSLDKESGASRSYLKSPRPRPTGKSGDNWTRGEVILGSLSLSASLTDVIQTQKARNYDQRHRLLFTEHDPIARVVVSRPWLNYSTSAILPIGGVLLSHYLKGKGKKWWWVPQVVGIIGNVFGVAYTRANGFPAISPSRNGASVQR
jgi:hypothetical protein